MVKRYAFCMFSDYLLFSIQAQCSLCQVELPPHLLVYHQQWQCDRRPLACVLCGSEGIAADELEAHESLCGQQYLLFFSVQRLIGVGVFTHFVVLQS
jgi:hypothetical protein